MTRLGLALAAVIFVMAATANSGGYRYGVSDQAFYTAAVLKDADATLYPRDSPLLAAESSLMWSDQIVAGLSRALHVDLPPLYLALYLITLVAMFAGATAFGRAAGMSWWAVAVMLALITFRHRIARTGANSLEGYMHPRMLAFDLGIFACADLLRSRYARALFWIAAAACWHPTTALWFGLVYGGALFFAPLPWRKVAWALAAGAIAGGLWAVTAGPLAGRLVRMDPAWIAVVAEKDYLFPHEWPLDAWAINLAYPIIVYVIHRRRQRLGIARPGETPLVMGLLTLAAVFLISVPFTMLRLALAVQMQITRVFWVLDFAAIAYACWWLMDDAFRARPRVRQAIVGLALAASLARGGFLLSHNRQFLAVDLPDSPWTDAMRWLKGQPADLYVLADPIHTFRYGVSVRVAAQKDTLVERAKDTALAMYDRRIAMQVADRLSAVRDFNRTSAKDFRTIAEHYALDVLIVEKDHPMPLDLPELYRNDQFVIYRLK